MSVLVSREQIDFAAGRLFRETADSHVDLPPEGGGFSRWWFNDLMVNLSFWGVWAAPEKVLKPPGGRPAAQTPQMTSVAILAQVRIVWFEPRSRVGWGGLALPCHAGRRLGRRSGGHWGQLAPSHTPPWAGGRGASHNSAKGILETVSNDTVFGKYAKRSTAWFRRTCNGDG